jgi:hypothetical protein
MCLWRKASFFAPTKTNCLAGIDEFAPVARLVLERLGTGSLPFGNKGFEFQLLAKSIFAVSIAPLIPLGHGGVPTLKPIMMPREGRKNQSRRRQEIT